ncbi:Elongator complex protein 5 [Lophiotrema nucula]|uniref:Elongator complex protein 5 n=1 Tax=Lophiotrema nucula TaxID=690887 RepID=A0A6A5ZQR4_9PLEO|nr:Elongator complex protein 5 [Lophiotrema nucula]
MPQPVTYAQHARHSTLMLSRVLSLRTNASPFTLVLDDLNQPAGPLLKEVTRRGLSRNVNVVVISFERKRVHPAVRLVPAWGPQTGEQILALLENAMHDYKESVVVVDSLYELLVTKGIDMNTIFQLVAVKYNSILFGVYHADVHNGPNTANPYAPQPLDLVKYMATTILTCQSFAQVLADKRAKERSIASPLHGIGNEAEGAVQALTSNTPAGIVLAAEFRRRSGKPEYETFFLRPSTPADYNAPIAGMQVGTLKLEFVTLLNEHPAYCKQPEGYGSPFGGGMTDEMVSTFNLELTAKQKEAREGVVLPYFDAQKEGGGEGGRILYDMGVEDDFDEEEDEI